MIWQQRLVVALIWIQQVLGKIEIEQPADSHQARASPDDALSLTDLLALGITKAQHWLEPERHPPPLSALTDRVQGGPDWEDLDQPLVMLSEHEGDAFTVRDSYAGTLATGQIGAGKSTGSLRTLAKSMMQFGYGGLVLTSTPDEKETWLEWGKETGREKDIRIIEPYSDAPHQFNFLNEEANAAGDGRFLAENLVVLMTQIIDIVEGSKNQGGNSNADFFEKGMKGLLRATVTALLLAGKKVTLDNCRKMIATAPQDEKQVTYNEWKDTFCATVLWDAKHNAKTPQEAHDFDMAYRFYTVEFPRLGNRTRSSIVATATGNIDAMQYGLAHHMLGTQTTITPDLAFTEGAILLVNTPIQEYFDVGAIVQGVWKYMFQKSALRRDTTLYPRGVFLAIDEYHYHLSSYDPTFQSVARRAKCASLFLTQSISQIVSKLHDEATADSLLGNFTTKVFHTNSDHHTNSYASQLIGDEWRMVTNYSTSQSDMNPGSQTSGGGSMQLVPKVTPSAFTTLKRGGPQNDLQVEGIIFQGGRIFNASGNTYLKAIFDQRF